MIFYLGEKIEDKIPREILEERNQAKSWRYGYDSKTDVIVISRDGTVGEVYLMSGIYVALPQVPEDKSRIINSEILEPEKQRWKRKELPTGLDVETQFDKRFASYIEREYERRDNGVFVMIKGNPVYLTGLSYFLYQWFPLDEGYPTFRIIQNELMTFWEACKADQRCYGMNYTKNRRFGLTSIAICEAVEAGTRVENSLLGMISKTGDDARSMFSRMIRGFKRLPCFFVPVWDGTTTPKKELLLSEPTKRKATQKKMVQQGDGLGTIIKWFSTTLNSMDGERVYRSVLDESGKWPKDVPFDKYWSIVKTSHRVGARIVGKSIVASTVNAMSKGGLEFKNVFYQSDPEHRSKNGQTQSGLYKLFIPARYCIEGFFDKWGFSIVDDPMDEVVNEFGEVRDVGSVTYLANELEMLENKPDEYNEFLRQFPDKEEHAFRDEASDCRFDLTKLYEQLDFNDYEMKPGTIQRGNFYWKNGVRDSQVVWNPDPNGRFHLTWHPPEELRNKVKWVTKHGVYAMAPVGEEIGAFGCDPYNRSQTVKKEGSKGSIHLVTKFNMADAPGNEFILEYIDRPRKVEEFFEDVIKVVRYYSMPILIELSNENMLRYLKERGYRHFSKNRPGKLWKHLSPTEKEFGGVPAQSSAIADAQYYAVEAYINDHVGVCTNPSIRPMGQMGRMPFSRTLLCWKDVDPENRQKYDAYISSSLALLANQSFVRKETKQTRRVLRVKEYQHVGQYSQPVEI